MRTLATPSAPRVDDVRAVREVLTMRAALEGFAASRAAMDPSSASLDELRSYVAEMRVASVEKNPMTFFELDLAFHEMIVKMARHDLLHDQWVQVTDRYSSVARLVVSDMFDDEKALADLAQRHLVLIDPIEQGDPDEARRRSEDHPLHALRRYELARRA